MILVNYAVNQVSYKKVVIELSDWVLQLTWTGIPNIFKMSDTVFLSFKSTFKSNLNDMYK